jgi:hypothetical protein
MSVIHGAVSAQPAQRSERAIRYVVAGLGHHAVQHHVAGDEHRAGQVVERQVEQVTAVARSGFTPSTLEAGAHDRAEQVLGRAGSVAITQQVVRAGLEGVSTAVPNARSRHRRW